MARTGRPKLTINQDLFEGLCRALCTKEEICGVLNVSESTLHRWVLRNYQGKTFDNVKKAFGDVGRVSLRRAQITLAQAGNPTMLIWLGKQYLQQRDKQEISGPDGGPIQQEHSFTDDREAARYILKSYIDQGLSEIEARTRAVEAGVDPAALPAVNV